MSDKDERPVILMTSSEIRRSHLMRILAREYGYDRKAFGEAAGKTKGLINNWINERRTVGNTAAREVEENLGLPYGYLDQPIHLDDTLHITRGTPPAKVARAVLDSVSLIERRCRDSHHNELADLLDEAIQKIRQSQNAQDTPAENLEKPDRS